MPSDQFALKIVDEYKDRENHKLNLIFHKISEPPSTDLIKHQKDDKRFVSNVIKDIDFNLPGIITCIQLI